MLQSVQTGGFSVGSLGRGFCDPTRRAWTTGAGTRVDGLRTTFGVDNRMKRIWGILAQRILDPPASLPTNSHPEYQRPPCRTPEIPECCVRAALPPRFAVRLWFVHVLEQTHATVRERLPTYGGK